MLGAYFTREKCMHVCLFSLKFLLLHICLVDFIMKLCEDETSPITCIIVLFLIYSVYCQYHNNQLEKHKCILKQTGDILIPYVHFSTQKHFSYASLVLAHFLFLQMLWFSVIVCDFISSFMSLSLATTPNINF